MLRVYLLIALLAEAAWGASGEDVFKQRCSGCHEQNNPRIPRVEVLRQMPASRILRTLNYGAMISVAYTMTIADREAVANYLGIAGSASAPAPGSFCADRTVKIDANPKVQWNGWSPTTDNARFQSASGLTLDGAKNLKLKWAFAYDGDTTAFAQPTILDGNLFTGSAGGVIHALDAQTGCIRWTYEAGGPVRSSILAVKTDRGYSLLFGDQTGWFYSLDAANGHLLWKKKIEAHDAARLTGSPVAYNGTVFVPVASWEENRALEETYPCCTFRGSLVALRVRDGAQVWRTYTVDPAKESGKTKNGAKLFGPSGAPIWTAPTLDATRGLLYVTTGDNYSPPATVLSDAVLALNLKTGKIVWSRQFTENDIFTGGCANQGITCGPDFDFGSSAILVHAIGRDLLLAGQKSGVVHALDPDRKGETVWEIRVGKGGTNGGVQWGMASDGQQVYAATSDLGRIAIANKEITDLRTASLDPQQGGGLTAIRISDGTAKWFAEPHPCDPPKTGCSPAQPSAVTAIPGVVFSGSVSGHMRAYSAEDGKVLWDFDTAREFETVNGVKGRGGSIDGAGPVIANGMVYVNSGYARQNGMPGNVLLAFGAE